MRTVLALWSFGLVNLVMKLREYALHFRATTVGKTWRSAATITLLMTWLK